MALVEVQDVTLHGGAETYGLSLALPGAGTSYDDTYSFPLEGRLESADALLALDLFHAGTRLTRILGGGVGVVDFSWPANALAMPPSFAAELRAILPDRTQAALATIHGLREALRTDFEPALQPLSVTSLGRSGSTVLIRALEQHPDIAACPAFEYETSISLYWLSVLRDLSEPASYGHALVNDAATPKGGPEWWRASHRPIPPPLADARVRQIAGRDAILQLATLCQAQIDLVYRELADRFGRPGARYFAEKTMAGPVLSLQDELYPEGREVVLIRDFRDQLCSAVDFYARTEPLDVRRGRDRVLELARHTGRSAMTLLERYRRAAGRAHVLRYEDMVLQPAEAFAALLEYLSLPAEPAVLAAMSDAVARRDGTETHRTVTDAAASIGRWQRDLAPDVIEAAVQELRAPLESFGYS